MAVPSSHVGRWLTILLAVFMTAGSLVGAPALATPGIPPDIQSTNTTTLDPGTTTFIRISVTGVDSPAEVTFTGAGVDGIITSYGSSRVRIQVNVDATAEAGLRDMTITNPDGLADTMTAAVDITGTNPPAATGDVAGHVFEDTNGNGLLETGELGLEGVSVVVEDALGESHGAITDAEGNFTISMVAAGVATITYSPPGGYGLTTPNNPQMVDITADEAATAEDVGYVRIPAGGISGRVFADLDGNGIEDGGDAGWANASIDIVDAAGVPHEVMADPNGDFVLANVPVGEASVTFATPAGSSLTTANDNQVVMVVDGAVSAAASVGFKPANEVVFVSAESNWTVDGVTFEDEDIAAFDLASDTWAMMLDGSSLGLGATPAHDIDAFHVHHDGKIVFSVAGDVEIEGMGSVDNSDLVAFDPAQGTLALLLQGASIGLTTRHENIDAVSLMSGGEIIFSVNGSYRSDDGILLGRDEDLFIYDPSSGDVALHYDASDTGEFGDIGGVSVVGNVVSYVTQDADDLGDILSCEVPSFGSSIGCTPTVALSGVATGLAGIEIDGLSTDGSAAFGAASFGPGQSVVKIGFADGLEFTLDNDANTTDGNLVVRRLGEREYGVAAPGASGTLSVKLGEVAAQSDILTPGEVEWRAPDARQTVDDSTVVEFVPSAAETRLRWDLADAYEDQAPGDHSDEVIDPALAIERAEGVGGALCNDFNPARVVMGAPVPVRVCVDSGSGLIKVMNESSYWVDVEVTQGTAIISGSQYDGPDGPRRALDILILGLEGSPSNHLPPNGAVNFLIPAPYVGDVVFSVDILRINTLLALNMNALPGDAAGNYAAALEIIDVSLDLAYCIDDSSGLADVGCAAGWIWDIVYALIRNSIGSLLSLPWDLAVNLFEWNRDMLYIISQAYKNYGNSFTVLGPDTPDPPDPPPPPIGQTPPPQNASGELYSGGLSVCAATYVGHPRPDASWSASVDVNAALGDYGRTLYMPWDGTVTVYTTGYGGGWGNSWILTRADGYELFIAHGLETLATGPLSAGTAFGRAGNTGFVIGTGDNGGAHLHLNARKNGQPAPIVLGGTTVAPGVCWTTRTGSVSDPGPGVSPPPGGTMSVTLQQGAAAPFGFWYDVTLSGFPANTAVPVSCNDAEDQGFYVATLVTNASGYARDTTTCYSSVGGKSVTAGGLTAALGQTASYTAPDDDGPVADQQSLRLLLGAPAPFGHWYDVTLTGYPANSTIAVSCHDAEDTGFYTAYLVTDGSGYARDTTTCYSSVGGKAVTAGPLTAQLGETVYKDNTPPPPPPPNWTLSLSQGAVAPFGYWYDLTITGPASGVITVYCNDSVDLNFWTQTFTLNASGQASDSTLCYSADGPAHWVTSSVGATSNTVNW